MSGLDHQQGRNPWSGQRAMFSQGFTAGATPEEDIPVHFVRVGGRTDSHPASDEAPPAGTGCPGCMALAARARQRTEDQRLSPQDPPGHET